MEADESANNPAWERWEKTQQALYRKVEALPATRENVAVKARMLQSSYLDEPTFNDADKAQTTDELLARQIIMGLARDHAD